MRHLDAHTFWKRCYDCGCNYRLSDEAAHFKKHIARPRPDLLTPDEVAQALKVSKLRVRGMMRRGVLFHEEHPGFKPDKWVKRSELKAYAERMVAKDPGRIVGYAETGKL